MKTSMIIVLLCMFGNKLSAQNNAIFTGGSADGWDKTAFQQGSNNIFTGGSGDGFSITLFAQAGNNIFTGGTGDGWDKTSFAQAINNIFTGGIGDGWDKTSFAQPINAIFGGGAGDGWDKTTFTQSGNNIFFGGAGDGWANTYRPMAPLPVTMEYFTATKVQDISALLKWKTSQELNSARFDVERSTDAMIFTKIGSVNAAGNSNVSIEYSFTDNAPMSGLNYYRIKQIDFDGKFVYTPARVLNFANIDAKNVRYFPNPTNGTLYVELPASIRREAAVINIFNAAGAVLDQQKLPSGSQNIITINLQRFPKGIYFIQVKTTTVNSTQRVVLQ